MEGRTVVHKQNATQLDSGGLVDIWYQASYLEIHYEPKH
jgi:hypothetical protein